LPPQGWAIEGRFERSILDEDVSSFLFFVSSFDFFFLIFFLSFEDSSNQKEGESSLFPDDFPNICNSCHQASSSGKNLVPIPLFSSFIFLTDFLCLFFFFYWPALVLGPTSPDTEAGQPWFQGRSCPSNGLIRAQLRAFWMKF